MLEASFDANRRSAAAITGAYQYDTGQRIRMFGLPDPLELLQLDDLLSGNAVSVQAQYARPGESQSEPRIALYDEQEGVWIAAVPDEYLTQSETVNVYVYVSYGADTAGGRGKTLYTGSFRPASRPAPSDSVTPDQLSAWDALVGEVNLTIAGVNAAVSSANAAAQTAREAAAAASGAAGAAQTAANAANAWGDAQVSATTLAAGKDATVTVTDGEDGKKHLAFAIPRGAKGEKGDMGPAGVTFRLEGSTLYITTDS